MLWFGYLPGWQVLLLPVFAALAVLASLGPGLLITALNIKYRDFRYIIPFIVQLGLYVSPVGFSSTVVPDSVAPLVQPQSDGRRHRRLPLVPAWRCRASSTCRASLLSLAVVAAFLWLGVVYFRRTERTFADLI